jgi:hypothetical protein
MTHDAMMQGREFLVFADQTTEIGGRAASWSRISRYYYAAYLEYRQHFVSTGHLTRSRLAREHQVVKSLTAMHFPDVAEMMNTLRLYRNMADYELDIDVETMQRLEQDSRTIAITLLEKIDAMPG